MKNAAKRGKSVRNGNSPSPYQKYQKRPHKYSAEYYQWRAYITGDKKKTVRTKTGREIKFKDDEYRLAA